MSSTQESGLSEKCGRRLMSRQVPLLSHHQPATSLLLHQRKVPQLAHRRALYLQQLLTKALEAKPHTKLPGQLRSERLMVCGLHRLGVLLPLLVSQQHWLTAPCHLMLALLRAQRIHL